MFFFNKNKKCRRFVEDYYLLVLEALAFLFAKTEVKYWEDYINFDIKEWVENKSVKHHLQAYGAMGSINDLVICLENKHSIKSHEEAWANTILERLLVWCSHSARYIEEGNIPSGSVLTEIEAYKDNQIQGWRCLQCGYSELKERNVDTYIAPAIVEARLNEALSENEICECIMELLTGKDSRIESERENMVKAIDKSGIQYVSYEGFLRPCPNCNSEDTAVYRWNVNKSIVSKVPDRLIAAQNNLPIRG